MKVCVVKKSSTSDVESVAIFNESSEEWIPLRPFMQSERFDERVVSDVLYFLGEYPSLKPQLHRVLSSNACPSEWAKSVVKPLPFKPQSWRDCSLWESHMIKSARNLVKNSFPLLKPVINLVELFGITFPVFKPNDLWYQQPLYYMGNHMALYGEGDEIPIPRYASFFDYELELGVVIAKSGRNMTAKEAEEAIGGFVIWNDFSVRNVQLGEVFGKLGFGKTKNSSNQMGSVIVTTDELLPKIESGLEASCKINSKLVAKGSTKDSVHTVPEAIAFISQSETLYPGEVVGLGTIPGCCGIESNQKLNEGDNLQLEVEHVGTLSCRIGKKETHPEDHWKDKRTRKNKRTSRLTPLILLLLTLFIAWIYSKEAPINPESFTPGPITVIPSGLPCPVQFVQDVEFLRNGSLAPESFAYDDVEKVIYTSMRDGSVRIINFETNENRIVARTGSISGKALPELSDCTKPSTQHLCGVPLGLSYTDGKLYVADAYFGIMYIDIRDNYKIHSLVTGYENEPFKFANNAVTASNGIVYFTDSSTKWPLSMYQYESVEGNGYGRLFSYDPKTGKTELLLSGLHFANGLALSTDETILYVAETTRYRIREYHISSPSKVAYLMENIPCFPDNIRVFGNKLTIGCAGLRSKFTQSLSQSVTVKKTLSKAPFFTAIFTLIRPKKALVLVVDIPSKKLSKAYYDPKTRFHSVSEANMIGDYMYIGSFHNPFVARFKYKE